MNRKDLSPEEGTVLDHTILPRFYLQGDRAEKKKEGAQVARSQSFVSATVSVADQLSKL